MLDAVSSIRGLRGRPRRKPRRLYADRGYDCDEYRRLLWKRGIKPMIARRGVAYGSGLNVRLDHLLLLPVVGPNAGKGRTRVLLKETAVVGVDHFY